MLLTRDNDNPISYNSLSNSAETVINELLLREVSGLSVKIQKQ